MLRATEKNLNAAPRRARPARAGSTSRTAVRARAGHAARGDDLAVLQKARDEFERATLRSRRS
jgi:hypothetical protein